MKDVGGAVVWLLASAWLSVSLMLRIDPPGWPPSPGLLFQGAAHGRWALSAPLLPPPPQALTFSSGVFPPPAAARTPVVDVLGRLECL